MKQIPKRPESERLGNSAKPNTATEHAFPHLQVAPSPVIELNRAVAVAMAYGPGEGLKIADELAREPSLKSYHLLPAVRGDLLEKLGRVGEARAEFERAASLTRNEREREILLTRAAGVPI